MTEPAPDDLPEEDFKSLVETLEEQVFVQRVDEAMEVCAWLASEIRSRQHQDLDLIHTLKLAHKRLTRYKTNHL